MKFSPDLRDGVAAGEITVSIRRWSRPQVKAGGRYRQDDVIIEIDAIELLPFSALTAQDVQRTGEVDREAVRKRAAHAGPVEDETLVYRLEFRVVRSSEG